MNVSANRRVGCVAVWLLFMSLGAYAASAEYICLGMQRGQITTVTASSLKAAIKIAKDQWGAAGCYKK
jgi:hypothetical protein